MARVRFGASFTRQNDVVQDTQRHTLDQERASNVRLGIFAAAFCLLTLPTVPAWCQSDWPMYGHDESSTRFSPLNQINTQNVQTLSRAWTYHMKKDGPRPLSAGAAGRGGGRRHFASDTHRSEWQAVHADSIQHGHCAGTRDGPGILVLQTRSRAAGGTGRGLLAWRCENTSLNSLRNQRRPPDLAECRNRKTHHWFWRQRVRGHQDGTC